jgi:hypothetical protein
MSGACLGGVYIACRVNGRRHSVVFAGLVGRPRWSLRRRGRSDATTRIYGQSYTRFWDWALAEGLPPDPGAVSTAYVNRWVDSLAGGRRDALIARRIALRDRCTS